MKQMQILRTCLGMMMAIVMLMAVPFPVHAADDVCSHCAGSNYCDKCVGVGDCQKCFGRGYLSCTSYNCSVTGKCIKCGGDGKVENYSPLKGLVTKKCTSCNNGRCKTCGGDHEIKCSSCSGSGNCRTCNGSGNCTYCNGRNSWNSGSNSGTASSQTQNQITTQPATPKKTKGACGDNLTWTLDKDGTLTISGTGKMADYIAEGSYNDQQWEDEFITEVIIEDGVTSIGAYAFSYCTNLTSVTLPSTIESIGSFAFCGSSNLEVVNIPNSTISIGTSAFSKCTSIKSLFIPSSVTEIKRSAFKNWTSSQTIYVEEHTQAPNGWKDFPGSSCSAKIVWDAEAEKTNTNSAKDTDAKENKQYLEIDRTKITLTVGGSYSFSVTGEVTDNKVRVEYDDKYLEENDDGAFSYTALQTGTTTIKFVSTDGSVSASCKVTIKSKTAQYLVSKRKNITLRVGESYTFPLYGQTKDNKANAEYDSDYLKYEDGFTYTARKVGTTKIKFYSTDKKVSTTCTVTILPADEEFIAFESTSIKMKVGETMTFNPDSYTDDDAPLYAEYYSDYLMCIDGFTFKAIKAGTTTIEFHTKDNSVKTICTITITEDD